MSKSIYRDDYLFFLNRLRNAREKAGLTQEQIARKLDLTQTFVSKCERGERRIDIVELRDFCDAIGISLAEFVADFESSLRKRRR